MSGISDYQVSKWLTELRSPWVALHYADPDISGAYASEVFGGSYSRVKSSFTIPVNRTIFNDTGILFRGLPNVKVAFVSGWDAQFNGNMLWSIPMPKPVTVLAGKSFQIVADQLAVSLPST